MKYTLSLFLLLIGALGVLMASDAAPKKSDPAPTLAAAAPAAAPAQIKEPEIVPQEPPPGLLEFFRKKWVDPADPKALAVGEGPKGEFSGKVVDGDGNPVAGVLVDAWDWCPGDETHTAADGTFRLKKLDPKNRIEVRFIKEGFAPYTIVKQPLGALTAPVVLDNQTHFEGVVTGPDGEPVANAFIRANQGPKQADGVYIGTIWTETHSDAQGRYRLLVQDETYEVQVTAPGGLVLRLAKQAIGPKETVVLNLPLEAGVIFRAHIVDSVTGDAVAGVRLKDWQHPGVVGVSNAQGNLEISGLIPGEFEFQVEAKAFARWWSEECKNDWDRLKVEPGKLQRNFDDLHFDLSRDMKPVTITLERNVRIRGRVIDPAGNPVAGATAAPAHTGTGNSLTGDTRFSVKTKADGTFEMVLPASGDCDYNLIAHDGDYKQWRKWANGVSEPFRTKPGETIEDFELRLNKPATVRGRVVDDDGKPVADREVRAQASDLRDNRYYDPTFHTDAEGRFEIKFVRPGKHSIQAAPFGSLDGEGPVWGNWSVEIAEGETVKCPDLTAPDRRR